MINMNASSAPGLAHRLIKQGKGLCKLLSILAVLLPLSATTTAHAQSAGFASTKPTPRVEYWQNRLTTMTAELADSKKLAAVNLVFIGDSITDFWLLDDNPWVAGQKYGRPVWDAAFGERAGKNRALNMGISGDRLEHILYRIQPKSAGGLGQLDSPDLQPEFIVTLLGINNTWAAEEPVAASVFAGVKAVLDAMHARKPKAKIILQSLLPTNDRKKNTDVVLPVNRQLVELAQSAPYSNYVVYLDLFPGFVDPAGQQIGALFTDGLHPNVEGYKVWRDRLLPFIEQARSRQSP